MDLFPETKDFQPSTHIDLDRDAALWDDYITQQIKRVTKEKPVSIVIAWQQKDVKKGYAVGSVIVKSTQSESKFIVPIMIKDFKLAPLDVAMQSNGKMSSLTEDKVDDLLFDGNIASGTSDQRKQPYEDIIPQAGGMNGLDNGYTKTASIMKQIWTTIDDADWRRVQNEMAKPEILYKFAGEKSRFIEIFKQKLVKPEKETTEVEAIKKIGVDSYMMMSNSIENFSPSLEIVSSGQVVDFINKNIPEEHRKDFVETLENNGVILDWSGKADGVHVVDDSTIGDSRELSDPGFYRVKGPKGEVDGMYIKAIYEPVSDRKSTTPVFISGAGGGPQQGKPKGISISDCKLPIKTPAAGDYGYFLYIYKNEPLLVGPYTVKAVSVDRSLGLDDIDRTKELESITAAMDSGKTIKIVFSDYASGFSVFDPKQDTVNASPQHRYEYSKSRDVPELTLPRKDSAWVPCNDVWEIGKLKEEVLKTASVQLRKLDGGGYEFKGLEKHANWKFAKDDIEASFLMRCFGAPLQKISSVMDKVKKSGIVYMNIDEPWTQKKASAKYDLSFVPKKELTKIASIFEDMTTIDAVLSLNFINNDNISKFVTALPQFEKVREELLRLLVICRLGNIEIPESVIKQAIDVMDKVINGLHTLKARM
jgi:hypothetical protein